jgi:hypothetical protein
VGKKQKGLFFSMIPAQFDEQFLAWFRRKTENMWSLYRVKDDLKDGWHDRNWEPGLRWLKGLSNQEIIEIE